MTVCSQLARFDFGRWAVPLEQAFLAESPDASDEAQAWDIFGALVQPPLGWTRSFGRSDFRQQLADPDGLLWNRSG